jgi:sterol desaturase/sphingolipid hydroxylase (fatty acid hydroxylase superfamily)
LSELVALQGEEIWKLQLYAVATFLSLCFVEGILTRRSIGSAPPRELVTDFWFWFLSPAFRVASRIVAAGCLIMLAIVAGHNVGPELFHGFGPIARQPKWMIFVETLVLSDFMSYWAHRLMHTVPFLWRFHAIHHSATTIRWSTTARVHPVNELVNYIIGVVPCFLLGLPLASVLSLVMVLQWYAIAAHSHSKLAFGPLGSLFASPVYHHWHHTPSDQGGNKNFANMFSLWDRLFGTFYLPEDRLPEVFGLDHNEVIPENYWKQLLHPFSPAQPEQLGAANALQPNATANLLQPTAAPLVPSSPPGSRPSGAFRQAS